MRAFHRGKHDHIALYMITVRCHCERLHSCAYVRAFDRSLVFDFSYEGQKLTTVAAFQGADDLIVATSSRAYVYMQLRNPAPIYSAEEFSMSRDDRTRARGNHEWSPPLNARGVQLHNHNHTSTLLLFISLQRRPSTKVGLIRQIRFSILWRNRCHIDCSQFLYNDYSRQRTQNDDNL